MTAQQQSSLIKEMSSVVHGAGEDVIGPSVTASTSLEESSTFSSSGATTATRIASPNGMDSTTDTDPAAAVATTTTTTTEVDDQQSYYSGEEEEEEEEEEENYDEQQPALQPHLRNTVRTDSFSTTTSTTTTATHPPLTSRTRIRRSLRENDGMILNDLLMAVAEGDWMTLSRLLAVVSPKLLRIRSTVVVRGCPVRLFPLHYLCTANPPVDIVERMIQIDPSASKRMDRNGRYAIHWAVDAHGSSFNVVKVLLTNHPESCYKQEDRFGFLPLHIACFYYNYPPTLVEYNQKQQQQQQQQQQMDNIKDGIITSNDNHMDDEGNNNNSSNGNNYNTQPYHHQYYYHYNFEEEQDALAIIQTLLQIYPEGASIQDNFGWIPLHIICRTYRRGADIVQLLLGVYPQGAKIRDNEGRLPIHWACCHKYNYSPPYYNPPLQSPQPQQQQQQYLDSVVNMTTTNSTTMVPDSNTSATMLANNNLIDTSYYYDPVDSMVKALIQIYPEGATKREMTFGFLPIHIACASPASLPVIQRLLDIYPDGCRKQDKNGSLPLHMACRVANSPPTIVQSLLRTFPEGAQFQDRDCRVPLHWACHVRSTCETTVASLLSAFPDAAQLSEGKYGYLPLHIACKCGASEAVLAHLLAAFPEGSRVRDNMGNLPIHIACGSELVPVSEGVIGLLLLSFPESLERTDQNGCTPLMVAEQNECYHPRKYAITGLLQSHPAGWRDLAFPIRLKFLEFPSRTLEKKFMAAIQRDHEAQKSSWLSTDSGAADEVGEEAEEEEYYEGENFYRYNNSNGDKDELGYNNDWRARNHYQLRRLSNNAAFLNEVLPSSTTSEEQPFHHLSECFDNPSNNDYSVEEDTNEVREQPATSATQIIKCVLCNMEPVRYVLYPCGHPCLCEECAETKLVNLDHICPVGGCAFQDLILVHGTIVGGGATN